MLQSKLTELKDFILEYNTYFDDAFMNVHIDEGRGWVVNDKEVVFPRDNKGAYFYMRNEEEVRFERASNYDLQDAWVGTGIRQPVILVACMRDADPDAFLNNIISTIQQSPCSKKININFVSASYETLKVIDLELARVSKEIRDKAKQNSSNWTIVRVKFDCVLTFKPTKLNCIENPCSEC